LLYRFVSNFAFVGRCMGHSSTCLAPMNHRDTVLMVLIVTRPMTVNLRTGEI